MLIKSVHLRGHPGVGDLDLDFTDGAGNGFRTVVLAGGNGSGKTAVLEAIQRVFEGTLGTEIGTVTIVFEFDADDVTRLRAAAGGPISFNTTVTEFTVVHDSSMAAKQNWAKAYQLTWEDPGGSVINGPTPIMPQPPWRDLFRTFFSEASVNFSAPRATTITSTTLDSAEAAPRRSGSNLAAEITQLLIDVRAADAEDLAVWVRANIGATPPTTVIDSRFSRFTRAFQYMFPGKRFHSVARVNEEMRVEFLENGRVSTIDQLSTGEKQIVFRAGFLLRDLIATAKSIILIDEPELSLHPDWQEKILAFYVALLSDANGKHPQIITATHSPFIVHGAANAKTIVLEKNPATGAIGAMATPVYPSVSGTEAVRAFNIDAFLDAAAQGKLLVLTEGETDAQIMRIAWDKLNPGRPRAFEFRSALGAKNINITLNDGELLTKLGGRPIVGLFDFDDSFDQWKGVWGKKVGGPSAVIGTEADGLIKKHPSGAAAWTMLLPVPTFRANYASRQLAGASILPIEFMFEDADLPPALVAHRQLPMQQSQPYIVPSQKTAFANNVSALSPSKFVTFTPVFDRFDQMLSGSV